MTDQPDDTHNDPGSPSDAEIDSMLKRTDRFALLVLSRHPQRDRAIEILQQGGWLFAHPLGNGRHEFRIGWFDDPRMRPDDADPNEYIVLMRLPRTAVLGQPRSTDS
jgi:hypothetical protein